MPIIKPAHKILDSVMYDYFVGATNAISPVAGSGQPTDPILFGTNRTWKFVEPVYIWNPQNHKNTLYLNFGILNPNYSLAKFFNDNKTLFSVKEKPEEKINGYAASIGLYMSQWSGKDKVASTYKRNEQLYYYGIIDLINSAGLTELEVAAEPDDDGYKTVSYSIKLPTTAVITLDRIIKKTIFEKEFASGPKGPAYTYAKSLETKIKNVADTEFEDHTFGLKTMDQPNSLIRRHETLVVGKYQFYNPKCESVPLKTQVYDLDSAYEHYMAGQGTADPNCMSYTKEEGLPNRAGTDVYESGKPDYIKETKFGTTSISLQPEMSKRFLFVEPEGFKNSPEHTKFPYWNSVKILSPPGPRMSPVQTGLEDGKQPLVLGETKFSLKNYKLRKLLKALRSATNETDEVNETTERVGRPFTKTDMIRLTAQPFPTKDVNTKAYSGDAMNKNKDISHMKLSINNTDKAQGGQFPLFYYDKDGHDDAPWFGFIDNRHDLLTAPVATKDAPSQWGIDQIHPTEIDTAFSVKEGGKFAKWYLYFTSGPFYWKTKYNYKPTIANQGVCQNCDVIEVGRTSEKWPGIPFLGPNRVNAAFYSEPEDQIYFLRDNQYWPWHVIKNGLDSQAPLPLQKKWKRITQTAAGDVFTEEPELKDIDSAYAIINSLGQEKVWFFKGEEYFETTNNGIVKKGKIKDLFKTTGEGWKSPIKDLDGVFRVRLQSGVDVAYFFKKNKLWSYDFKNENWGYSNDNSKPVAVEISDVFRTPPELIFGEGITRDYKDILNGELANVEILGYKIEKYELAIAKFGTSWMKHVQDIYLPYKTDLSEYNFYDTQIKFDEPGDGINLTYVYNPKMVVVVYGSKMSYKDPKVVSHKFDEKFSEATLEYKVKITPEPKIYEVALKCNDETCHPLKTTAASLSEIILYPQPPIITIIPYKRINDRLVVKLNKGTGRQENIEGASGGGQEPVKQYVIYKTDEEPTSSGWWKEAEKIYVGEQDEINFAACSTEDNIPPLKNIYLDKDIKPNTKYYYAGQAISVHNKESKLSDIFSVEIVDENGMIFTLIDIYTIEAPDNSEKNKSFRKKLKIEPAFLQRAPNKERGKQGDFGFTSESVFSDITDDYQFKFRVTSKKTTRKLDLNVKFVKKDDPDLNCGEKILKW